MQRRVNEKAASSCITSTLKQGRVSVIAGGGGGWGASANCKVCHLHQVKSSLNQNSYHNVLQHHVLLSGIRHEAQGYVPWNDNDTMYPSKLGQRYIKSKEELHVLQLMSCPVQSADLNPIEQVWDELDRKLRTKQPTRAAYHWQLLQESWVELSSVSRQSFVERMPKI